VPDFIRFGDGFELDPGAYKLHRAGRALKLERIPMEVLLFLAARPGELITREQIVERIWGKDVFLDTDNSINGAIRKIRQVLKDDPEDPRFIQTVTGKGYRFIAPVADPSVQVIEAPKASASAEVLPASEDTPTPGPKARPWHVPAALVFGLLILSGIAVLFVKLHQTARPVPQASSRVMLAVLPFANLTGDANQEYFSDGLTEEMISELARLNPDRLGVIGRTSVMLYKTNPKPLDQIGRELGVQYVLEGSVRRDSDHVRITAQLIQVKDQTHVWTREYDRELKNLLAVQAEIAAEIRDELQLTLGWQTLSPPPRPQSAAAPTTSYEAYDLYLRGRYFWNKRTGPGLQRAADYFQQAIAKDPGYAQAYSGLADAFALMSTWNQVPQNEFMPRARAAALKALELDDSLAEAHTSLALISESYDYDWITAEKEFRRAIELNPYYATAHQWYGEFLGFQGRFADAEEQSERARQLDPLSLIIAVDRASIDYYSREYDRAIQRCRGVLEMDSTFSDRGIIVKSLVQQGKFAEALIEIDRLVSPGDAYRIWSLKANIYGRWGRLADAQQALAKARQFPSPDRSDPDAILLGAYVGMGRKDQAIALLQEAYEKHSNAVLSLKVEPEFDSLRSDPRFQDLLRRLRFTP
jgi:TolB-like protein/DNA-binding winged helix-turn-helix (wHTH) protein